MEEGKWRWCYILHEGTRYKSYRTHLVRVENNAYVRRLREAAKSFSWVVVGDKKEDGTHTRIKFDVPGGSPSSHYWRAPTSTAAPVKPVSQQLQADFLGMEARKAEHRRAWEQQYTTMQTKPAQEEPSVLAVRLTKLEDMLQKLVSQSSGSHRRLPRPLRRSQCIRMMIR